MARARRMYRALSSQLCAAGTQTPSSTSGTTPDLEIPYNNFFERLLPAPRAHHRVQRRGLLEPRAALPRAHVPTESEGEAAARPTTASSTSRSRSRCSSTWGRAPSSASSSPSSRGWRTVPCLRPLPLLPDRGAHVRARSLHWLPAPWYYRAVWRRIGLGSGRTRRNLNLMGLSGELRPLLPRTGAPVAGGSSSRRSGCRRTSRSTGGGRVFPRRAEEHPSVHSAGDEPAAEEGARGGGPQPVRHLPRPRQPLVPIGRPRPRSDRAATASGDRGGGARIVDHQRRPCHRSCACLNRTRTTNSATCSRAIRSRMAG